MLLQSYMYAVVSRFGLKAERSLGVGVDGPAGGLVLTLVCQGDLVATLLLHAFRQAADGDLATNAEPVWYQNQNFIKPIISVERPNGHHLKLLLSKHVQFIYVNYISGQARRTLL